MEFTFFGRNFRYDDRECGIYKIEGDFVEWGILDTPALLQRLGTGNKDDAIDVLENLRNLAQDQLKMARTPYTLRFPFLIGGSSIPPFSEAKQSLENTVHFTHQLLEELQKC